MAALRELVQFLGGLLQWWFIVVPWEQVVRVRLGKHVKLFGAGIHFTIPHADRLFRQSTRLRWLRLAEQDLTTSDGMIVTLQGMMGYTIVDLLLLYSTLHHAEATLTGDVMSAIARYVHSHTVDECRPADLGDFLGKAVNLSKYGIGNVEIMITDFVVSSAKVRVIRLLNANDRWLSGDALNTEAEGRGDY